MTNQKEEFLDFMWMDEKHHTAVATVARSVDEEQTLSLLSRHGVVDAVVVQAMRDAYKVLRVTFDQREVELSPPLPSTPESAASDPPATLNWADEVPEEEPAVSRPEEAKALQLPNQPTPKTSEMKGPLHGAPATNLPDPHMMIVYIPPKLTPTNATEILANFGPLEFIHFVRAKFPDDDGTLPFIGYVRYFNSEHTQTARRQALKFKPRAAGPFRAPTDEDPADHWTTCRLCSSVVTRVYSRDHERVCIITTGHLTTRHPECGKDIRRNQYFVHLGTCKVPKKEALRPPAPAAAATLKIETAKTPAAAISAPASTGAKKKVQFKPPPTPSSKPQATFTPIPSERHLMPPKMAKGPLVGWRPEPGLIACYTHEKRILLIQDEGQRLTSPSTTDLQQQLEDVYGMTARPLPC